MKSDGDAMETTEPIEAVPELPSTQEPTLQEAPSQPEPANEVAPGTNLKANGKPSTADPKTKAKVAVNKPMAKSTGASASNSRPGTAQRSVNDVKPLNNVSMKKTTAAAKSSAAAGAVPKRPMGVAAVSTAAKSQTKVPEKNPVGQGRAVPLSAAPITNGTKPAAVNGSTRTRPGSDGARARTAAPSRPAAASSAPKPSSSTATKAAAAASSKTNKPAAGPPKPRPATAPSRPATATSKAPTTAAPKTTTVRATTAPSAGKTAAAQHLKTAPPKKDVSRPLSAAAAKKPTGAAAPAPGAATRKPETSKPTAPSKSNSASKLSTTPKAPNNKVSQPASQPGNSTPRKKSATTVCFPANTKPPLGRTPPASPASKPTAQSKGGLKPTQAVLPLTVAKKAGAKNAAKPTARSAPDVPSPAAPAADAPAEMAREAPASEPEPPPRESPLSAPALDAVIPEANAAAEIAAGAPEPAPQESTPAASVEDVVAPVTDEPAGIAGDAPASGPPESPLAASPEDAVSPEVNVPAEAPASVTPESPVAARVPEEAPLPAQDVTQQLTPEEAFPTHEPAPPPAQIPLEAASSPPELPETLQSDAPPTQEQPGAAELPSPPAESPPDTCEEPLLTEQPPPPTSETQDMAANTAAPKVAPGAPNEDEDEEEREGSQLISVSEMSGTTQPTEDSRPGSAGPAGGSAWRAGGALLSELDSEEVSGSQQGASELSAPGVLEGTESMDDLGDGSLKGAIDMEGASAGSPDFEKVPDIPTNDFEDDEDDEDDRVCDMDVGSERADEPQRPRHDNDVEDEEDEEEDDDVEMASEGITESGLESYGNADEDDFVEDERLDNLNRAGQHPPPPPLLPSAPAAQWDQPNPWAEPARRDQEAARAAGTPPEDPWQADPETPTQTPAQAWLELGLGSGNRDQPQNPEAHLHMGDSDAAPEPLSAPRASLSGTLSSRSSTPDEHPPQPQAGGFPPNPELNYRELVAQMERRDAEEDEEAETLPADEVLGGPATAPASNPSSSSSASEDEPSDTEGEAHLDDSMDGPGGDGPGGDGPGSDGDDKQPASQRCLSTVEEGEEADMECAAEDAATPPSATSLASYGFDTVTTASNSNAHSAGESCIKSPGIFSLEELPDEPKKPGEDALQPQPCLSEQRYIECGKQEDERERAAEGDQGPEEALEPSSAPGVFQLPEEEAEDLQPPYYSAICAKTENSFAGFTALPHPHRPRHAACPRNYCDVVRPCGAADGSPKLDLPPGGPGPRVPPGPQLSRLERHQKQLMQLQRGCPPEEEEEEGEGQQREGKEEEEDGQGREEAEEGAMEEEEEMKRRRDLELQLQQQQEELKQRQQIMQWQQELQQASKGQAVLSPSSGLCTIYEALENSDEEEGDGGNKREPRRKTADAEMPGRNEGKVTPDGDPPERSDSPGTPRIPPRGGDRPPETPEQPSPPDLDWGKKVDIVQQLINQTLLLNREGCSSLLLLPGGAGGTLSPLESSLWPSLLPPLTPPSATVTSVSSFSPETTGSSPQEEWTVVELETHH